MSSDYSTWRKIEEQFQFILMLGLLSACGYLLWYSLVFLIFTSIFSGISAAMIPLYNLSQQKLRCTESIDSSEVQSNDIKILEKAQKIISEYNQNYPDKTGKLSETLETINKNEKKSKNKYKQRQQFIEKQRKKRNLKHGVPPKKNNECPKGYPIRVTQNLPKGDQYRGIYYKSGDPNYQSNAFWCFNNEREAKLNNFRPPLRGKKKSR